MTMRALFEMRSATERDSYLESREREHAARVLPAQTSGLRTKAASSAAAPGCLAEEGLPPTARSGARLGARSEHGLGGSRREERERRAPWGASLLLVAVGATSVGCYNDQSDCSLNPRLLCFSGGTGGTGTTTVNPGCIPNQTGDPIDDACGVFVDAANGDDANNGETKTTAVQTLTKAIAVAKGKPIYACADVAKAFVEAIVLDSDAQVFGGLDCTSWKYAAGTKTKWTAAADEMPLHVKPTGSVTIADVVIEAANATKNGGSSIALLAEGGASVELSRCEVTAGDGKAGETPMAPSGTGAPGTPGVDGKDGCLSVDDLTGGKGGALVCDGADVSGGVGGQGLTAATGGDGSNGQPDDGVSGLGGTPQKEAGPSACTNGGDGAEGLPGDPGGGATANGTLSESGYTGESGEDGASTGKPGQGGGGGGGAKKCSPPKDTFAGPSAGGGGSGGCGGNAGKGGGAGGASIAILSLDAILTLKDAKVTSHAGGKGGDGGFGQPGGDGGMGGAPGNGDGTAIACSGGKGGKGGTGGRGGGGRGGPSFGIAFTGEAPDTMGATIMAGTPGEGGQGDGAAGSGAKGMTALTQSF